MNAGNNEFFQRSRMLDIVEEALGRGFCRDKTPLLPCKRDLRALRLTEEGFYRQRIWVKPLREPGCLTRLLRRLRGMPPLPLPPGCAVLAGKRYEWQSNNSGILPLLLRLQQNNHTKGLRALSFERQGERFFACFDEGEGALYRLEMGFYSYRPACLTVGGEQYRVACMAAFAVDEEGREILMMHILFPELAHDRRIKLYYGEEQAALRLRERPGKETLASLYRGMSIASPRSRGLLSFIGSKLPLDYFLSRAYEKYEPLLLARVEKKEENAVLPSEEKAK
jgi:hypothetical protein